jgi:hypothetical protein
VTQNVTVSSYKVSDAKHVIADLTVIERQCVVEELVGAVPLRAREFGSGRVARSSTATLIHCS